jgi:hypothetical protein
MCEILLLWFLGKRINEMAGAKMRNGTLYVLMFVLLWFGGEVCGFIFGMALTAGRGGDDNILPAYFCALLGAACGAGLSFLIVGLLPHAYNNEDWPRRRRRRRDRDEEDEDDDDRPRRRRRDVEDDVEEDEDRPRRRRRPDDGSFEPKRDS